MAPIQCPIDKLVSSYILSLMLVVTPAALAGYVPPSDAMTSGSNRQTDTGTARAGYVPPSDSTTSGRNRQTDAGTTRGCSGGDLPLTVLTPQNHVGQTISRRPTFAWFVPDSGSFDLQFGLYESLPGGKAKAVRVMSLPSSPGIMKLSPFSEDEPGLEVDKEYFWQVVIYCEPGEPSSALLDRAGIKVVETPTALQRRLDNAADGVEKANLYGEAGFWYDALGEALKLAEASKLGELGSALLEDLARWEAPETTSENRGKIEKRIEKLRQIADNAR